MYNTPNLNRVMIVGTVANDPKTSLTNESKTKVCNFKIVSTRKFRVKNHVKEEPCFINVVAWIKLAELCENNLVKGDKVFVEGMLQSKLKQIPNSPDSKVNLIEILAERIQILTSKKIIINHDHDDHHQHEEPLPEAEEIN